MSDFGLNNDIAIIGMAGCFPGAKNTGEFWENLRNGVESISYFTDEELRSFNIPPEVLSDPNYVKAGAVLEDIEYFDAGFFGFSPREAELHSPQHRFFLERVWEALEHAGYNPETYRGRIGVYAGESTSTYVYNIYSNRNIDDQADNFQVSIGNDKDYLASQVSYRLNLKGPSMSVQTACSSSLVALCLACQSLLNYQCDIALTGGASINVTQKFGYLYQEGSISSPDGHCRPFDAKSKGTIGGNGVGVVVLKRLEDALADRDHIMAIIKGTAINNDGSVKIGFTAPGVRGQAEVIAEAMAVASIDPETINYIETHGTGTILGDQIEIAALTAAFRARTQKKHFCAIGSVKSNIGHLDVTAGVAGLIKTVMALNHQQIPPSLNYETPNPEIDFENSPFYVNTRLTEWKPGPNPRRASVSSFGIGGTNAHVVLEEAPALKPSQTLRPWSLVPLSARTASALEKATANLTDYFKQHRELNLADIAFTLQNGRKGFEYRRTILCQTIEEAIALLDAENSKKNTTTFLSTDRQTIVFMFPGENIFQPGLGAELYTVEPDFREQVDYCLEILKPYFEFDIKKTLFSPGVNSVQVNESNPRSLIGQLHLFIFEYSLAKLWVNWGILPKIVIGDGLGEYVAACAAEVFSVGDALKLIVMKEKLNGEEYAKFVSGIKLKPPKVSIISSNTGNWLSTTETPDPLYWTKCFTQTGRFDKGIKVLSKEQNLVFIEVGPGQNLCSFIQETFPPQMAQVAFPSIEKSSDFPSEVASLMNTLGKIWSNGVTVDWFKFNKHNQCHRVPLPTYPFERKRFWLEYKKLSLENNHITHVPEESDKGGLRFYIPSWKRTLICENKILSRQRLCWVIFQDEMGLRNGIIERLNKENQDVITVIAGDIFAEIAHNSFQVNPNRQEDYQALFTKLVLQKSIPQKIIHLWNVSSRDTETNLDNYQALQGIGFYSLLYLSQGIEAANITNLIDIGVVSNNVHRISDEKFLNPGKATIFGPCKVIPQEYENLSCRNIDITLPEPGSRQEEQLVGQIITELTIKPANTVIAYRNNERWVQNFESVQIDEQFDNEYPEFRQNGVYLITGGFGGMGLVFAENLARVVKARLVLVGRTPFPERNDWEQWLITHDEQNDISQKIKKIIKIEEYSQNEVLICSADVGDLAQMKEVAAKIHQTFGELNGIIHAAGIAGGGLIRLKTSQVVEDVFHAKVRGTLVLDTVFRDAGLDFIILCSSQRSIIGGFGQVDYSAANAFLDAYANAWHNGNQDGTIMRSINWDGWTEVGMSANNNTGPWYLNQPQNKIFEGISSDEGFQILNQIMSAAAPQIIVSKKKLEAVVAQMEDLNEKVRVADKEELIGFSQQFHSRPQLENEYTAPRNEREQALVEICQGYFGIKPVGIHDNFFELGGDSIIFLQIAAASNRIGIKLTSKHVFDNPTVAEIAGITEITVIEAEQGLVTGELPLTPIQQWFLARNRINLHHFNQAVLVGIRPELDLPVLKEIARHLLLHHDALRLRFQPDESGWNQFNSAPDDIIPVEYFDLSALTFDLQEDEFERLVAGIQNGLNITAGPLIRFAIFDFGKAQLKRLLIVIHHLAIDAVSWRFLLEDIQILYSQLNANETIKLPFKTTSFKMWSETMAEYARSPELKENLEYWRSVSPASVSALPKDFNNGLNTVASVKTISVSMTETETETLLRKAQTLSNLELKDLLLTALVKVLSRWTGSNSILIDVEGHGRDLMPETVDLSRTIGWFTSIYPVLIDLSNTGKFEAEIESMGKQLRKANENGNSYGLLRYLTSHKTELEKIPTPEICFLYLGQADQVLNQSSLFAPVNATFGHTQNPAEFRDHLIDLTLVVSGGQLHIDWAYSDQIHLHKTIEYLATEYVKELKRIIDLIQQKDSFSDLIVDDISQEELEEILDEYKEN